MSLHKFAIIASLSSIPALGLAQEGIIRNGAPVAGSAKYQVK